MPYATYGKDDVGKNQAAGTESSSTSPLLFRHRTFGLLFIQMSGTFLRNLTLKSITEVNSGLMTFFASKSPDFYREEIGFAS